MRTILLPLDGSVADRWALETGLTIAAPFGSHLTALLPKPAMAEVPVYAGHGVVTGFAAFIETVQTQAEARHEKTQRMIEDVASPRGIRLTDSPGETGPTVALAGPVGDDLGALMLRAAAVHDLVLYPRLARELDDPLPAPAALKTMLECCGRPVLIVTDTLPTRFATAAIAWNGSNEGGRAVSAALPFLHRADRIVVLTVATSKTAAAEGERLRDYLLRHGLQAEVDVRQTEDAVGEELIVAATAHGVDLLITGCYTHSRLRQSLFGGVTHHLLGNCTLPILMAR